MSNPFADVRRDAELGAALAAGRFELPVTFVEENGKVYGSLEMRVVMDLELVSRFDAKRFITAAIKNALIKQITDTATPPEPAAPYGRDARGLLRMPP